MSPLPNIKRGRMTADEVAEVERLGERGVKPSEVARRLNRHPATIKWRFILLGLVEVAPTYAQSAYRRGGVAVVPFDRDEDVFIQALRIQDYSTTKIADLATKRFGRRRSPHTINMRLRYLANVEA